MAETAVDQKRTRGPSKPFPLAPLEDVLIVAKGIAEHGVNDQIRRTTLFDKLERAPESGHSRALITNSGKYGLTDGSYAAEYLKLLDLGRLLTSPATPKAERQKAAFDASVAAFDVFNTMYLRLKDKRLPANDVLRDEFAALGIAEQDREQAVGIFVDNLEYVGLIRELSNAKRVIPIEQLVEELQASKPAAELVPPVTPLHSIAPPPAEPNPPPAQVRVQPGVHINVQIHIDASTTAEQIDLIFASMARNLGMGPAGGSEK